MLRKWSLFAYYTLALIMKIESQNTIVIPSILFNEFVSLSQRDISEIGINWKDYPHIYSRHDSFDKRMSHIRQGKTGSVPFASELKKFLRKEFNEYSFVKRDNGCKSYQKLISSGLYLILEFEPINHSGLGKAYTLNICVSHSCFPKSDFVASTNIFKLFYEEPNWPPCWTYSNKENLLSTFSSVQSFLKLLLPLIEGNVKEVFENISIDSIPSNIRIRKDSYSNTFVKDAYKHAYRWADDARLCEISSEADYRVRDIIGPAITSDGKLNIHGSWQYTFFAPSKGFEILYVSIPFAGSIQSQKRALGEKTLGNSYLFKPLPSKYIGSNEVMNLAEQTIAKSLRDNASAHYDTKISLKNTCEHEKSNTYWSLRYILVNQNHQRADLLMKINMKKEVIEQNIES